jgi:hypothetical protein
VIFEIVRKTAKTRAIGSYFPQKQRGTVLFADKTLYNNHELGIKKVRTSTKKAETGKKLTGFSFYVIF